MANRLRNAEKESFWRWVLKLQAESGLSITAFCQREGIHPSLFHSWKRVIWERDAAGQPPSVEPLKAANSPPEVNSQPLEAPPLEPASKLEPTWMPVEVIADPQPAVEIVHPGGLIVRLSDRCSSTLLREVFAQLQGAPSKLR